MLVNTSDVAVRSKIIFKFTYLKSGVKQPITASFLLIDIRMLPHYKTCLKRKISIYFRQKNNGG